MVALLETDALFVTVAGRSWPSMAANCSFLGPDGGVVASAQDRAGVGRCLARVVGDARSSRYEWDVLDGDGNRVLDIVKPSRSIRGPSPEVALADGRLLGRAVPERRIDPRSSIGLEGADGRVLGELVWVLGERRAQPIVMYSITDEDQREVGEIAIQTTGPWGFHLTFRPDADVAVRAMSIAFTLCLVQQRTAV